MKKITIAILISACLISAVLADSYLSDPLLIGVGARPMGMGKAYVAMAEDADAIFINPAGLARITTPKLSTMYSSLMNDVTYTVLGGAYPLNDKTALGLGVVNSRVADVMLTDATGTPTGSGSWGNSVMFLSGGTYFDNFILNRDLLVGGSLKYFSVGGSGAGVDNANGSGFDADLGLMMPATDAITLGVNFQNILPTKLSKGTGVSTESIAASIKAGVKLSVMGPEKDSFFSSDNRKLYVTADIDKYLEGNIPHQMHYGVEFWPVNNLALRAGCDNNNLTMGVGLRVAGVEFNYAYHPYSGINENSTQYFSINYIGEPRQRELRIRVTSPADKSVVYDEYIKVTGVVDVTGDDDPNKPLGVLTVKVNGAVVPVNPDRTFTADVAIEHYGKKLIQVDAADSAGDIAHTDIRLVRLDSFADVPDGYWAKMPIENNATVGLVQGYPDGNFRPDGAISRAELATLLVRAKGIKLPDGTARQVFKDVKPDFWASKYVEVAQREGLVKGYPDGTFRPNNKINRAEGTAVLARFDNLPLIQVASKPYWDISTNSWAAKYIQAAKDSGMLNFVERNRFHPKEAMVRAETVDMLGRTTLAGGKIKDLYTWEKGFKPEFSPESRPQIKAAVEKIASAVQ